MSKVKAAQAVDAKKLKVRKRQKEAIARTWWGNAFVFLFLGLMAAFMLLPFYYAIVQSLKPLEEIFAYPPKFYVVDPSFDNFRSLGILTNSLWIPLSRAIFNTVFVTVTGTVCTVVVSSLAAFPFAKYNFPGSKFMFKVITKALLFTGAVTAVPQYLLIAKAGMVNTYWALLGPAVAAPMGMFLLKNFMSQISTTILEAAELDGASIPRIWWQIILPNVKPAVLTLIILCFQSLWNMTGGNFIYEEKLKLLPTILTQISSSGIAYSGAAAAASVILMIPPLFVYILVQSRVLETMAHAGIDK